MKKIDFKTNFEEIPKPTYVDKQDRTRQSEDGHHPSLDLPQLRSSNDEINLEQVWKVIIEFLRMTTSPKTMKAMYSGVYLNKIENGVAELSCDNAYTRDWIESYHKNTITGKLEQLVGHKPELAISVRSSVKHLSGESDDKYEYYDPSTGMMSREGQQSLFEQTDQSRSTPAFASNKPNANPNRPTNLNPKYTLDNFIVGKGNQLAHAVAEGVVQSPGRAYNPVFFYGPSGVGKTHLMQAIGNNMLIQNPSIRIVYVPIETFMNELIVAIRTRKNEEFREKYREVDLLIIDDIQFISTYKTTREELFNTFNTLYQANKQIVIASDRPPKEIDNLPDRLRTRFEGGMVVDIQPPDLETRIAILQQKADESGVVIDSEVIMFVAQNIETSVRELEGAMTKISTNVKFNERQLSVDEVAKMLQMDIETKRRRINPDKIIAAVSEVFDVTPRDIRGKRRTAYIAIARQSVMFLLREELQLPLDKVAKIVNRKDHTTVIHACNKMEEMLGNNHKIGEKIELCRSILRS